MATRSSQRKESSMITELRDKTWSALLSKAGVACLILVLIVATAWFFGWLEWMMLATLLVGGGYGIAWYAKQRRAYTASNTHEVSYMHNPSQDTVEMPVVGRFGIQKRPKRNQRRLFVDSTGHTWLVYERHEFPRQRVFGKKTHTVTRGDIRLANTLLVNDRAVRRSTFEPIASEEDIFVYRRLHWVSHGPAQIGVVLTTGALIIALLIGSVTSLIEPVVAATSTIIVLLTGAGAYLWYWIPWAYRWFIVTDERILLIYDPPLWLKGNVQSIPLSQINFFNAFDQHRVFTWMLEKAGLPAYGVIGGDTPAQDGDEWIRRTEATDEQDKETGAKIHRGLRYVPHFTEVKQTLDTRLAARQQEADDRYEEDKDFQRRQAEASEAERDATFEIRDLLKQHLASD
jgi:hypothetical protein